MIKIFDGKSDYRIRLFFVIIALLSGFGFQLVGMLFVGDLAVIGLAFVYLLMLVLGKAKNPQVKLTCIAFFLVLTFSLFDVYNGIDVGDIFRGLARNGIFMLSILAGIQLMAICSVRFCLLICLLFMFCPAIPVLVAQGQIDSLPEFVKLNGGATILFILILYIPSFWIQLASMCGVAAAMLLYFDTRSGAAGCVSSVVIVIFRRIVVAVGRAKFILLSVALSFLLIPFIISFLTAPSESGARDSRQELSNKQRLIMAQDAFDGFQRSPVFGNGSWQHARNYMDETITEGYIGVHSWILQLAYEYGVLGLISGVFFGCIGLLGVWLFCKTACDGNIAPGVAMIGILLAIGLSYSALFSPFAGISRIGNGLVFGFIIDINFRLRIRQRAVGRIA